jgi:hypothetical protein
MDFVKKIVQKKIVIAAIIILVLAIIVVAVRFIFNFDFLKGPIIPLTKNYNIQQDYCGKVVDTHYCQCAFEGTSCEVVSMPDKETAYKLVTAGFESWVIEQKKNECAEKGGNWKDNNCRKKTILDK